MWYLILGAVLRCIMLGYSMFEYLIIGITYSDIWYFICNPLKFDTRIFGAWIFNTQIFGDWIFDTWIFDTCRFDTPIFVFLIFDTWIVGSWIFGFLYSKLCCPEALACGASHTSAKAASGFSEPVISGKYLCSPARRAGGASDPMKKRQSWNFQAIHVWEWPFQRPRERYVRYEGTCGYTYECSGGRYINICYISIDKNIYIYWAPKTTCELVSMIVAVVCVHQAFVIYSINHIRFDDTY